MYNVFICIMYFVNKKFILYISLKVSHNFNKKNYFCVFINASIYFTVHKQLVMGPISSLKMQIDYMQYSFEADFLTRIVVLLIYFTCLFLLQMYNIKKSSLMAH